MDWSSALTGAFGGIAVISVAMLQNKSQQNLKLKESLNDKKQLFYEDSLKFFSEYLDGNLSEKEIDEIAKKIRSINQEIIYYAPTKVVKSFGDLVQHLYKDAQDDELASTLFTVKSKKLFAELEVQIRKDLGHARGRLYNKETWLDMMRITTTDIDEYIHKRYHRERGEKTRPDISYKGSRVK